MYISIVGSKQNHYRLCRVSELFPDEHNNVLTCIVKFRPRHIGDAVKKYISKPPEEMKLTVQRFSTLLPVEIQGDAEFHRASDENLQRGLQRDRSPGMGIEASEEEEEHKQPVTRERRECRNLAGAYKPQCET